MPSGSRPTQPGRIDESETEAPTALTTVVVLPPIITPGTVLDFPKVTESCQIDASRVDFLVPAGLVQLALLLQHVAWQSTAARFIAPDSGKVDSFLKRMGFYSHVPNGLKS